jgi:hypothetical protein
MPCCSDASCSNSSACVDNTTTCKATHDTPCKSVGTTAVFTAGKPSPNDPTGADNCPSGVRCGALVCTCTL